MDEPNETTETTEEAPSSEATEEVEQESTEAPPWGDDFDPERAWKTIQDQRESEAELKQEVQRQKEILEALNDPERGPELLGRLGYELVDEDADEEDEGSEPYLTREEWQQWQAQQTQQEDLKEFNSHLDDLAGDAKLKLSQADRRYLLNASVDYGFNPDATEKAFKEWVAEQKEREKQAIQRYRESKSGSVPPSGGREATDESNRLDIEDDSERHRRMAERLRMAQQQ